MFLALRDLRVGRGRFVLVGVVIALVALLTTLLSGLANGLVNDGISGLRALPLTHLALQPGAQSSFSRSTLTDTNLEPWKQAAAERKDLDVSPLGVSFFNAKRANGDTLDLAMFGVPADSFLVARPEARAALAGKPGIVLSHDFEADGVKVGDVLTIVGVDTKLPVLGFTYAGSYGHVDIAFTSLQTWQTLLYGDNARGRFSAIAIRSGDDSIVVTVRDEGPGIRGDITRIFQRFYTDRPDGEHFGDHSGLGLAISKQIIDAHRGTISAANRSDRSGAVFTVVLPRATIEKGQRPRK